MGEVVDELPLGRWPPDDIVPQMVYRSAMSDPGDWMNETSGVLRPAVEAYLNREPMTDEQIAAMRAYLQQWIAASTWRGAGIDELREWIAGLTSRVAISRWLDHAERCGIDPL